MSRAQIRHISENQNIFQSTATQITYLARNCEGNYNEILQKISDLSATWQEIDSQIYLERIGSFREEFDKMKAEIDHYVHFLIQIATVYDYVQLEMRNPARQQVGS